MRIVIIGLVGALAVGCSATIGAPDSGGTPLTVTRLRTDQFSFTYYSQLRQSQRLVIRDNSAWQAAWASLFPSGAPIAAPPNVDFSKEMVVLAALGERSTGGFGILVDSAKANASDATIWISTFAPGSRCVTTQAFTQPVDIAKVTRTAASVHFTDVSRVSDCP
jgi:hypothetical protein